MGNFKNVSMGSGILKINDLDVGFLKGDVAFRYFYDLQDFKTGVPVTHHGSITKEVTAELTAPLAEITAQNLAHILGGLTPTETISSEVDKASAFEVNTFSTPPWTQSEGIQSVKLGPTNNKTQWVAISTGEDAPEIWNNTEDTQFTENTDYIIDYKTGYVYRNPGGSISSEETIKAKYKYTPPASKQIQLGASFSLSEVKVEFQHTNPNTGKKITVLFWKANANGDARLTFAEKKWIVNNVTFKSIYDPTHADNPLGFVNFET